MQEMTTGAVTDFLDREGCECLNSVKLLAFLAGALQRYEEEGVVLNPKVVLCSSAERFIRALPGGRYVQVGQDSFNVDSGKQVLKQCANLSVDGWSILIERNSSGSKIRYGVISYLKSPTSLNLADMVSIDPASSSGESDFAILVERIDPKTVLLSGARGNRLRVAFSTTRIIDQESASIDRFSKLCSKNADKNDFASYLSRTLFRILNDSHGTILVCQTGGRPITKIKGMKDAIVLSPPLDLFSVYSAYRSTGSADSILELQRTEALVGGIIRSDGIVVFDDFGRVTAYRVFFQERAKATGLRGTPKSAPIGGARRRAFEGLKALVGSELACSLFRSQDGLTVFQGA